MIDTELMITAMHGVLHGCGFLLQWQNARVNFGFIHKFNVAQAITQEIFVALWVIGIRMSPFGTDITLVPMKLQVSFAILMNPRASRWQNSLSFDSPWIALQSNKLAIDLQWCKAAKYRPASGFM